MGVNFKKIEKKWQKIWEKYGVYKTKDFSKKQKFYCLDMFPYPSGEGLHVGHIRGYIATDVISRMKMMQGYNVLHPMGWDAFGLPAENYAISHKIHPEIAVRRNIKNFKKQLKKLGLTYDWSREINTTDPEYYKWTQWIFLQFFKKGLVYESLEPVYFCPSCKTGLALEDLEGGKCERCGSQVEKRPMRQWVIKITKYADQLLNDLKELHWPENIIKMQKNWIGKSEGAIIKFPILKSDFQIEIFTTRLDTIFGATFLVLAPEHEIIQKIKDKISNLKEVESYIEKVKAKTDFEREVGKEKEGIKLEGIFAINPFSKEKIPVFVSDYVLPYYGTGAIMGVPAHDQRDFEFAQKYNLPIKVVISPTWPQTTCPLLKQAFEEDGWLMNSGQFSGLSSKEAREKMLAFCQKERFGKKAVNYRIRDWVFAHQRYWGEPFPLVFCENCKKKILEKKYKKGEFNKGELLNPGWVCIPEKDLPVKLPRVKYYEPSGTGESPLVKIEKWTKTKCPKCGSLAKRETNTMPQWAGSCWYYLAYILKSKIRTKNPKIFFDKKLLKYWLPVDLYVGGAEHATRHLIYARFWHKFLKNIGILPTKEPFKRLKSVGIVLAQDGRKMSKRWRNIINPDDIVAQFGADSLRLYEMFMGPFSSEIAWQEKGVVGMKRFLERVLKAKEKVKEKDMENLKIKANLHKTIKKVTEDIENFKFNTAISKLMIFFNEFEKEKEIQKDVYLTFIKLLAPFTPHFSEEVWQSFKKGKYKSIFQESWPKYEKGFIKDETFKLIIQINGKTRDIVEVSAQISESEAKKISLARERVKKHLSGKEIKKIIYVPKKLINFVV